MSTATLYIARAVQELSGGCVLVAIGGSLDDKAKVDEHPSRLSQPLRPTGAPAAQLHDQALSRLSLKYPITGFHTLIFRMPAYLRGAIFLQASTLIGGESSTGSNLRAISSLRHPQLKHKVMSITVTIHGCERAFPDGSLLLIDGPLSMNSSGTSGVVEVQRDACRIPDPSEEEWHVITMIGSITRGPSGGGRWYLGLKIESRDDVWNAL